MAISPDPSSNTKSSSNSNSHPQLLYADDQSAIRLSGNPHFHERTKHVNTRYHFAREAYPNPNQIFGSGRNDGQRAITALPRDVHRCYTINMGLLYSSTARDEQWCSKWGADNGSSSPVHPTPFSCRLHPPIPTSCQEPLSQPFSKTVFIEASFSFARIGVFPGVF